jgi:Rps23 Pro-64 3,4-dihydroxylase Tpa1-like proline 4-hydroxylase
MTQSVYALDAEDLTIDAATARAAAAPFAKPYQSGKPYHHICIDNFLPEAVLEKVNQDIASLPVPEGDFNRSQERLKSSYNPDRLPMYTRSFFHALNSKAFLLFLEEMTGIKGLIPDPYFMGAGIHRVSNGGHLDIHADFNLHGPMQLERRLNVLIYLNHDWKEEFGGSFEIWDDDMKNKLESYVPIFNRMCCFSTSSTSMHGNPETVNHPNGENRHSIALYYYTATWGPDRKSHSTLFKPRPGTKDETDRTMIRRELAKDLIPPMLYRRIAGKLRKIGL